MSNVSVKGGELLLVVGSFTALAAAGLDIRLIDAVSCPPSSVDDAANADAGTHKIIIGHRRFATVKTVDEVRIQMVGIGEVMKPVARLPKKEIATIVELLHLSGDDLDHDRFKHEFVVLNVDEMADRMKCTAEAVREG